MRRTGLQQPRRVGTEEVSVAAHFVHRPDRYAFVEENGRQRIRFAIGVLLVDDACRPDHVVKHVTSADRGAAAAGLVVDVVDFLDLERGDVAILGQSGRNAGNLAPPIGRVGLHVDFTGLDDQIRSADRPRMVVGEHAGRRHVGGVALRRAAVDPFRDLRDFCGAQRRIALKLLNPDVLLDVPRRHDARARTNSRALLDGTRPWPHFFKSRQRHWRDAVVAMAILAAPLKEGRDVPGERHVTWPGLRLPGENAPGPKSRGSQQCEEREHGYPRDMVSQRHRHAP